MSRVKRGVTSHARHKKVLKQVKGQYGRRKNIATPSYNQVTKPIYTHAEGRWKKYEKQISNIYPILDPWIKKFKY